MSGLEILGIAASVIQIAELGGRLSVKLFTFGRKIKNADKNIDSISQDIAATGAVLQQLGNTLRKDEQTRLCSEEAVVTAKNLVAECNKVFTELNDALDGRGTGNKLVLGWKQRLKFPFLEPQIDLLKRNLESLKSSLLVMLNVLVFAEQIKNREALPLLRDQRALIEVLVEDSNTNKARFDEVAKRLEGLKVHDASEDDNQSGGVTVQQFNLNTVTLNHIALSPQPEIAMPAANTLNTLPQHRLEEIVDHSNLVSELVDRINAVQWKISHGLRNKMYERVLDVHWQEWSKFRKLYSENAILQVFSHHREVVNFWISKTESEALTTRGSISPVRSSNQNRLWLARNGSQQPVLGRETMSSITPDHRMAQKAQAQVAYEQKAMHHGTESVSYRSRGSVPETENHAPPDYQMQLMLLEQQNKKRLMMARQEQDNSIPGDSDPSLPDYQMQLMLLEQQNKKRLVMARQEQDNSIPSDSDPSLSDHQMQLMLSEQQNQKRSMRAQQNLNNSVPGDRGPSLQYYQIQLMHLEQQNKKRKLSMTQQEQDINSPGDGGVSLPGQTGMPRSALLSPFRADTSPNPIENIHVPNSPQQMLGMMNEMPPPNTTSQEKAQINMLQQQQIQARRRMLAQQQLQTQAWQPMQRQQPQQRDGPYPAYQTYSGSQSDHRPAMESAKSQSQPQPMAWEDSDSGQAFNLDFSTRDDTSVLKDPDPGSFLDRGDSDVTIDFDEPKPTRLQEGDEKEKESEDTVYLDDVEALIMKFTTSLTREEVAATRQ